MACLTDRVARPVVALGDLLLGSPMGVRERAEFEDLIGPFVNLLVIRQRLDGARVQRHRRAPA